MKRTRKMVLLKKTSTLKPMDNSLNTSVFRIKTMSMTPNLSGSLMALIRRDSMKLLSIKGRCNLKNFRKNTKTRRDNSRL